MVCRSNSPVKIENAPLKAYVASGHTDCFVEAKAVAQSVTEQIRQEIISVEEVQDLVEQELMASIQMLPSDTSSTANEQYRTTKEEYAEEIAGWYRYH